MSGPTEYTANTTQHHPTEVAMLAPPVPSPRPKATQVLDPIFSPDFTHQPKNNESLQLVEMPILVHPTKKLPPLSALQFMETSEILSFESDLNDLGGMEWG